MYAGEDPHSHEEVMENLHINPNPETMQDNSSDFKSANSIFTSMDFEGTSLQYRTSAPDHAQHLQGHQTQQFRRQLNDQPPPQQLRPTKQQHQPYQQHPPTQHQPSNLQSQFQQQRFQQHQQLRAQVQNINPGPIARPVHLQPPHQRHQALNQDHFPALGSPQRPRARMPPPGFNGSQIRNKRDY